MLATYIYETSLSTAKQLLRNLLLKLFQCGVSRRSGRSEIFFKKFNNSAKLSQQINQNMENWVSGAPLNFTLVSYVCLSRSAGRGAATRGGRWSRSSATSPWRAPWPSLPRPPRTANRPPIGQICTFAPKNVNFWKNYGRKRRRNLMKVCKICFLTWKETALKITTETRCRSVENLWKSGMMMLR